MRRLVAALAILISSLALPRGARAEEVPFAMRDATLPNGLRLITDQAARVPLVSVVLAFGVSAAQDPPNRSGLTELAMELMTHRSKHVKDDELIAQLDELATTWRYRAGSDFSYMAATVAPNALERIFWLFSDAMAFSVDALDQPQIDRRVALLGNERTQIDDVNAVLAYQLMQQTAFPSGHPYHHFWDNTELAGVTVAEVADYEKRYFVPRNAVLAVTGAVDRDEVVRLVTKYFGSLAGGATMPRTEVPQAKLGGETRIEVGAPFQSTTVQIAWPTPAHFAPGDAELDAVAGILDGVRTARLRWELDTNKHLVSAISAHQQSWRYASEFLITATVRQGHTPDEVIDAIDTVIRDMQTSQPTTDDFNGALFPMLTRRAFGYERSFTRGLRYADWIFSTGTSDYLRKDFDRYTFTPARVLEVAARALPFDRRVVSIVTPEPSAPPRGVLRRRTFKPAAP